MKKFVSALWVSCAISTATYAQVQGSELIDAFAALPAIEQAGVSADGTKLAVLRATSKNGDYIIEVRNVNALESSPVRLGADKMEITGFNWLNNKKLGVRFRQNIQDGNRNYWVVKYAVVNADGSGNWLVPFREDNRSEFNLLSILPDDEDEILLEYDINANRIPDVVRLNINTGRSRTVMRGNEKQSGNFVPDAQGEIRAASGYNSAENTIELYARADVDADWVLVKSISPTKRETFSFLSFSKENPQEIYVRATRGEDKAGIYLYNIKTGQYSERLFGLESVDVDGLALSNKPESRGALLGFTYTQKQPEQYYVSEHEEALFEGIKALFENKFVRLSSRSNDDNAIVIFTQSDKDPGSYFLLRDKKDLTLIGNVSTLTSDKLSDVKYISFKARDGRKIPAYVTIPKGVKPFPTVVLPHGGPWARDVVIYDEWSQLLASHGYLVIQPQFRGSEGFGLEHWIAGDEQWGLKMQDDMDDAAQFLVSKGLAKADQLSMFGWSFGGYSAFVASMRENNIYRCSIAGAGVSDLGRINATLNESRFSRELQRPTIKGVNPLDQVEKVNVPILVIHGSIDQRVPVEHSRLFVEKLKKLGKDYKYIELEGADHFSNTLFYDHKTQFYNALVDWLNTKCK
ncbi:prolyl oligopeptidase family serine peptidase [Bowmanella sp. Y26]|uniref:alpha/beta hydrolase family protein n=1 Tax=Bowmanella yangjiangensis TaxID=2811230 RepID=UPI001BDBF914|nr:prolyl oligopeptidase family serine peptidase [Bowmanella yangjiangensis]MBT1062423.1 prolyl oligopeptidase family serine peptidase [Bowmanella yangjiangensis]